MKILILSHYFPPEVNAPASRIYELARHWVRSGHEVTVVTAVPNHPRGEVFAGYRNRLFQAEDYDGVRVLRIWTLLSPNAGTARRTVSFISYPLSLLLNAWRIPRSDVVVSTTPQFFCGLAGLVLGRRPWVLEVRDLWPKSIEALIGVKDGLVLRALRWLERLAYRKADAVVSVTDSFVGHIRDHGAGGPIEVIKNGVDLERFAEGEAVAAGYEFRRSHGLEGKTIAAYVGTHGMAHGLETVIEAAARMQHRPDIVFLLVGDGSERARLAGRVAERRLDNVIMLGELPKDRMPGVWHATDISLVLLRGLPLYTEVIPSKMFEAMAMQRPMVLGVQGEARALLDAANAGIGVTPESASEVAAAVESLVDNPAARREHGAAGRRYVEAHFDRAVLAQRYLEFLERVRASAGGQR